MIFFTTQNYPSTIHWLSGPPSFESKPNTVSCTLSCEAAKLLGVVAPNVENVAPCFSCLVAWCKPGIGINQYHFFWLDRSYHVILPHYYCFACLDLRWWLLGLPAPNLEGATSIPWHDSECWNLWTNQKGKGYNISWYVEKVDQLIAFNCVHMFACSLSTIGLYM